MILFLISLTVIEHLSVDTTAAGEWKRPTIVPIPITTTDVATPVISLNGPWKFTLTPPENYWLNDANPYSWSDISVPGECVMQGYNILRGYEYPFKKQLQIPKDFRDKTIILRFSKVFSYAKVWVNGTYIKDHDGGFTTWDCDITNYVNPGETAWITVGVTDKKDDISWGSYYAKHNIGGILGDVQLIALPEDYVTEFHVETDFDDTYTNAVLKINTAMNFKVHPKARINFTLIDPQGNSVVMDPHSVELTTDNPDRVMNILVSSPYQWDAEHPHLYTLQADVIVDDSITQTLRRNVGFREIAISGNKLFVNGNSVKLRGVNRHTAHPTMGRAITAELDEQDVKLFKDANINFIRTSHYPPSEAFLDACDKYGMYVEEESAVCFVGSLEFLYSGYGNLATQNDPEYKPLYMNQFAEMIERDRSHPSVLIWSLGNENHWGKNFQNEYDYVKREDPGRPVIFSYPKSVPAGINSYDIFSHHYLKYSLNMGSPAILYPVLHDEFAHIPCYNKEELKRDPGVRNFWGETIKIFAENIYTTDGVLGGAIWGSVDEVFQLPDMDNELPDISEKASKFGYGEWGIIDGWRRKKPEYWLVKKAYSPIKVQDNPLKNPGSGNKLEIPVENRHDHTNLNEIAIQWKVDKDSAAVTDLSVEPHAQGILTIPAREWNDGDIINLKFYRPGNILIDEFNLLVGEVDRKCPGPQGPTPKMTEDNSSIQVSGNNFSVDFSKSTGLIRKGQYNGDIIITGGPFVNLVGIDLPAWSLEKISTRTDSTDVVIQISGFYGDMGVSFDVGIDGSGLLTITYTIADQPAYALKGYSEVGISLILSGDVDKLTWCRRGLWSAYPSDHIGRNSGTAYKKRSAGYAPYGTAPAWSWAHDVRNYYLFGKNDRGRRGTNDFRSTRENIWFTSAVISGTGSRVRAEADADVAVRAEVVENSADNNVKLHINNLWNYPNLFYGNYRKDAVYIRAGYTNIIRLRLIDHDDFTGATTK